MVCVLHLGYHDTMKTCYWVVLGLFLVPALAYGRASKPKAAAKPTPATEGAPVGDQDVQELPNPLAPEIGPLEAKLGHDLTLRLPDGYLFWNKDKGTQLMEKLGNPRNERIVGLVSKPEATWLVEVMFDGEGYVKDDEAEKLDADAILDSIREGTEAANKIRVEHGFKPIHVDGWSEPPRYDRATHHLIWGIRGKGEEGIIINYNTRVLGRRGYASLNLIDDAEHLEASKQEVAALLGVTTFDQGSRYQDFDGKKDKVAEYGLAALVAGGAGAAALKLVKVGLLAKFAGKIIALLIAFKKLIILAIVGAGAAVTRLFGRKKKQAPTPTATAPQAPAIPPPTDAVTTPDQAPSVHEPGAQGGPGGEKNT
jgi:uncharacterized membrane-anchored protein